MSFVRLFVVLLVTSLLAQLVLPWWSLVLVCLLCGFGLARSGAQAGAAGFLAIALGWLGGALIPWLSTHSLLPDRVAKMLSLPGGGTAILAFACTLGGVVGALATLTGWWLRMTGGRGTRESRYTSGRIR